MYRVTLKVFKKENFDLFLKLRKQNIVIYKLCDLSDSFKFSIRFNDFNKLKRVLKINKIEYEILFMYNREKLLNKISIFVIPVIFSFVLGGIFIFKNKNIYDYEIVSDDIALKEIVETYVKENYVFPIKKEDISLNDLKLKILSLKENIGFCNVSIDYTKLNIYVKKITIPNIQQKEEYENIVAKSDGIITRVNVLNGTLLKKVGDVVKKGETIIAGYEIELNDKGEEIKIPCYARGQVYANTWYSQRLVLTKSRKEIIKKEILKDKSIFLFSKEIGKKDIESTYIVEEKTKNILGVLFKEYVYYEEEEVDVVLSEHEINNLVTQTTINIWDKIPENALFIRQWTNQKDMDNVLIIDIYYEVEESINVGRKTT